MRSPMQIQSFFCYIDTGHLSAILTDKTNIPDQAFGKILFQRLFITKSGAQTFPDVNPRYGGLPQE